MSPLVRRIVPALACVALFACKEAAAPLTACTDPVVLTIANAAQPRFSWSPGCLAFRLGVTDSLGAYVWEVEADSGNSLAPAITYGVAPAGAASTMAPAALETGHRYAVGLFYVSGDSVVNASARAFVH